MDDGARGTATGELLPGGLAYLDDEPLPAPAGRRQRVLRTLVWLVVVAALLGTAAVLGVRYAGESDVRSVLASSTSTYGRVIGELRRAADAEELAAVAVTAPRAADELSRDLGRLRDAGGMRRAALAAQVAAERDVLLAVADLADVDRAPLRVWGDAHDDLADAVDDERAARAALASVDDDAARRLPDTDAALRRVTSTVGEALVRDVTGTAADLLGALTDTQTTADVRAIAERAGGQRRAVLAASERLEGSDSEVLGAFSEALQAVSELAALTPDDTSMWAPVRDRLATHLAVVGDADGSVAAGAVRGRLPIVLGALDDLVAQAAAAQAAWEAEHAAAVAAQTADTEALAAYAGQVRAVAAEVSALRTQLDQAVARGDQVRTGDLVVALEPLWVAADRIAAELATAAPPPATAPAHAALTDVASRALSALTAAREQVRADGCVDCPATDSAAWQSLLQAQTAAASWPDAVAAWESAVVAAEHAIATRPLPTPPESDAPAP
jgi:hypothetical protein